MSRRNLILSFFALFILRFAIGFHFFNEGSTKLKSGSFDATYFLMGAKGPLKEDFASLIPDADGKLRLCYDDLYTSEDGEVRPRLDSDLTFAYWRDFLIRAAETYEFGSPDAIRAVQKETAQLQEKIRQQKEDADSESTPEILKAEFELRKKMAKVKEMDLQRTTANEIIERHENLLDLFLAENEEQILAYFRGEDRIDGFTQDGPNRKRVATQVESLLGQVKTIESDRDKKAKQWFAEVESLWDSLEREINALASEEQRSRGTVELVRPFDPPNSRIRFVNQWIPWFDVAIGCLLMLGLFSRLASLLGAGFLASVVATQPPWIIDAAPTYYQMIELAGLLVIFATCAGRYAGLDYFIHLIWTRYIVGESNEETDS